MTQPQPARESSIAQPDVRSKGAIVAMKFEVVVIPVSDVDRAKQFYGRLGWRLDADYDSGKDFRVLQFTPPGSGCSIIFGKNVTPAAPSMKASALSRDTDGVRAAGSFFSYFEEAFLFPAFRPRLAA